VSDQPAHQGGEGVVYFSADGGYVVKTYHRPPPDKRKLLQYVIDLGRNLGDDEQYLAWPLGIVDKVNGTSTVGVVTRRVPSSHAPLYRFIYSPVDAAEQFQMGRSWLEYVKMARGTAAAVRTIHGKGMAHADVHFKNFLANPVSGEVVLIDLDGLVVKGFTPPQVMGMPGFIAPEVLMGRARPDELTDRHSLAVLVLWILLLRNVMMSQQCYDPDDPLRDDWLGFGEYACFSENPTDRRNWVPTIGTPLYRRGALSYKVLTPELQKLAEQALIAGLRDPAKRPQAPAWERALAEAYDLLAVCATCHQSFFYPYSVQPAPRRQCPFCGTGMRAPFPILLELLEERAKGTFVPVRPVILGNGYPLFADLTEPGRLPPFTRRGVPVIGQVAWDTRGNVYRLINHSDTAWMLIAGGSGLVRRGESVALRRGVLLGFGHGKRLARIIE